MFARVPGALPQATVNVAFGQNFEPKMRNFKVGGRRARHTKDRVGSGTAKRLNIIAQGQRSATLGSGPSAIANPEWVAQHRSWFFVLRAWLKQKTKHPKQKRCQVPALQNARLLAKHNEPSTKHNEPSTSITGGLTPARSPSTRNQAQRTTNQEQSTKH
jgi:hypothetical protein